MKILDSIFRKLFKRKDNLEDLFPVLTNKDLHIIGGQDCPKCHSFGLFRYPIYNYKDKPFVYKCEECFKSFSEEEYNRLLNIAQRRQKLEKINEKKSNL